MFYDRLAECAATIDEALNKALEEHTGSNIPVHEAMRYAVRGGKRLRGYLAMESAAMMEADPSAALSSAMAIEAMHSYSLIHDDLPCMDDDDMRRGCPTVHRKWDEATAVLAGDALQTFAFQLVLEPHPALPADIRCDLALRLAKAAGAQGMVLGQARDISAGLSGSQLSLSDITALQAGKTGALIVWSATVGAYIARRDPAPLAEYGDALGLAFQIWDDVLDVEGSAEEVGKAVRKDAQAAKATFVSHLGLEGSKRRARDLVDAACDSLSCYHERAENLREAARFAISRRA